MKEEKCANPKCQVEFDKGIIFHNNDHNFPYMKEGEWMHMECYIEFVIEKHFKKLVDQYGFKISKPLPESLNWCDPTTSVKREENE